MRWIELTEHLDFASKLDRSPSFIRSLIALGEESAGEFLATWSPET
jgi:hypothetical protein